MAREKYLDHLATVPLFSGATTKELRAVAKASMEMNIEQGKQFVTQGEIGREAFIIVDGQADVSRAGNKITTLGPGDCVGELALLDHGPRTATVTAATPLTVLVLGPREFSGLLDQVPTLNHKMLAALASKVRDLDSQTYS
ncbi:MAG TPA: cyclic nucleotide-binding domain-containing protein [Acidimicrobiales bacterium]|jgi:CRP/FNR family transcriptional regulator, cyclic AMP receptor protein|nr:cyclic nucleotide-binding domain-containing protein [Acidimicrobiales bacterium]